MKKINLFSLIFLLMGMVIFASCEVENLAEDAAPRLKVDKSIVQVIQNGKLKNGASATIEIVANKGFEVTSDQEWLTVDRTEGQGRAILMILAEANESGAVREGHLNIASLDHNFTVTVRQSLEEDTDDHLEIGHIYFADDFKWAVGGTDDVGNKAIGDARNIYSWDYAANGFESSLKTFKNLYDDLNEGKKTVYTMDGYLKFNKTNTITAIAIKDLGIDAGKTTSVRVSFKCARYNSDKTTVCVAIEGDGSIAESETANNRVIKTVAMSDSKLSWTDVSVDITAISSTTRIIIGEVTFVRDNISDNGTFRWYMDDLKVEKIEG